LGYSDIINAADVEVHESDYWFVSRDSFIYRYNIQSDSLDSWELDTSSIFTEITISDNTPNLVWVFDAEANNLVSFNPDTNSRKRRKIKGNMALQGISLEKDNFLILAQEGSQFAVLHYLLDDENFTHLASWYLEGFGETVFNDIALILVLVVDKSELSGVGPIEESAELQLVKQINLPEGITQPSGIWSMDDGTWMLITDQAEMYSLSADFQLLEKVAIEFESINCNQGCTEAIVGGKDKFYALTDSGLIGHFAKSNGSYKLETEYQLEEKDADGNPYEYSALAHNPDSGEFYLITDQNDEDVTDELIILDSNFSLIEKHNITYKESVENSIYSYDAQGLVLVGDALLVLSEQFTKVLKLSLEGEILEVYELDEEDVSHPSDIAVRDGQIYIIGDHENEDPVPPVSVFEIEAEG